MCDDHNTEFLNLLCEMLQTHEVVVYSYRSVNVVYSLILNNGTILSVYISLYLS